MNVYDKMFMIKLINVYDKINKKTVVFIVIFITLIAKFNIRF